LKLCVGHAALDAANGCFLRFDVLFAGDGFLLDQLLYGHVLFLGNTIGRGSKVVFGARYSTGLD
jgi:hypothetical protein